jgi:hypothetical protein
MNIMVDNVHLEPQDFQSYEEAYHSPYMWKHHPIQVVYSNCSPK